MKKNSFWVILGVIVVLAAAGIGRLELLAEPTITATITAFPPAASGYCYLSPIKVNFKGVIHVSAACTVQYTFVGSDGVNSPLATLNCSQAGDYKVVLDRSFSQNFSGWEIVRVAQKQSVVESNRANFTVTCLPQPNIKQVFWLFCSVDNSQLSIHLNGTNFGDSKGTKEIKIGTLAGWTGYWMNSTDIEAGGPFNIIPWTQTYPITIVDGNQVVSNSFSMRFPYRLNCPEVLAAGHLFSPGTTLTISIYGLPATQGGLKFSMAGPMNSLTFPIVSWQPPKVKVQVPNVPGFQGDLYLWDRGVRASDDGLFIKIK
jgi:hypothetical protein